MDALHTAFNWLDHNRYMAVAVVLAVSLAIWLVGCQPMTQSVLHSDQTVTANELEREAAIIDGEIQVKLKALELARADIERQVALRAQAVEILGGLATAASTGTFTPAAGINGAITFLGLIGLGAVADNRRKDKVIANGSKPAK